jgi:hypothetical protein
MISGLGNGTRFVSCDLWVWIGSRLLLGVLMDIIKKMIFFFLMKLS